MTEMQNSQDGLEIKSQEMVQEKPIGKKSSFRFQTALAASSELVVQRPEVVGWENLEKIPNGMNPVIAGTHLRSDFALQIIARELDKKFDIGIALQSGNRKELLKNTGFTLIGQDNLYDIDNTTKFTKVDGKSERDDKYALNFDNYEVMNEAMNKGKTLLISAHYSPIYDGILPNKPGFAAIYLAHRSGQGVVLPVALDIYTDDPNMGRADRMSAIKTAKDIVTGNRPKSKMTICEPIILDPIDPLDIDLMKRWVIARVSKKPIDLNPEEREKAVAAFKRMRQDGEKVMYVLAEALPPERRGIWSNKPATE